MDAGRAQSIARAFLPARRWGSRYDYYYTRTKLRTDPLYPGVLDALQGDRWPVLDVGCGLGLLAHALRAHGRDQAYLGMDIDRAKIPRARTAAARAGLEGVRFETGDAAALPHGHRGSVAILDVLHYLPTAGQAELLGSVAGMLEDDARLVIRTPLAGDHARGHTTRVVDRLAHTIGWMQTVPRAYPTQAGLESMLALHGLQAEFRPLYGRTPFNNWLLVARRSASRPA
ncbi:MAG TPA: class I SAM-dependent methyltransferase [Stenotrophomonas sp.]